MRGMNRCNCGSYTRMVPFDRSHSRHEGNRSVKTWERVERPFRALGQDVIC